MSPFVSLLHRSWSSRRAGSPCRSDPCSGQRNGVLRACRIWAGRRVGCRSRRAGGRAGCHVDGAATVWARGATVPGWTTRALDAALAAVEVRRSRRRTRTVSAFREAGRTVVAIPDRFTRAQEREWVRRMVTKMLDVRAQAHPDGHRAGAPRRGAVGPLPRRARPAGERRVVEPAGAALGVVHAVAGHHPDLDAAARRAVVGAGLRAAARAGPPAPARARAGVLGGAGGLPAHRAGPRVPRGPGVRRGPARRVRRGRRRGRRGR